MGSTCTGIKDSDPDAAKRRREGRRTYDLKYRAIRGDSTSTAFGPGSSYEIDSTVGDVCLVSSRDPRLIIGRPIIYVVVDTFSRMVVGFTVGLEGPSWRSAVLAFANVAIDKVEYCRSMDIEIMPDDWPVEHLPESVLADRGELKGRNADLLPRYFNVRVANTPPGRADWKPVVEKHFDLVNQRIVRWLPGAVRATERGGRDYRLDAALTLAHLRKILTLCFLEHNKTTLVENYPISPDMRRDRVRPYPIELWRWGLENRTGGLKYVPPEVVLRRLLPRAKGVVTERGLRFRQRFYACDLMTAQNWLAKARQRGYWRVDVVYDPWSSGRVWMDLVRHDSLIACDEIPDMGAAGGVPWDELRLEAALDKVHRNRDEGWRRQSRLIYGAQIERVLDAAKDHVASVPRPKSRAERLSNIRTNRQQERTFDQQRQHEIVGTEAAGEVTRSAEASHVEDEVSALDVLVSEKGRALLNQAEAPKDD